MATPSNNPAGKFLLGMLVMAAFSGVAAYWLAPGIFNGQETQSAATKETPWKPYVERLRHPGSDSGEAATVTLETEPPAPAKENERLLRFKDEESFLAFIAEAERHGVKILGRLDPLRVLRVAITDPAAWNASKPANTDVGWNFVASIPEIPEGSVQAGAVGFGTSLRDWLGITGDNTEWGKGVTVAVLDTGVVEHPGITTGVRSISLLDGQSDANTNGHGTGVASLIAGSDSQTPGIAPAAELLSIQIADATGMSDTFLVAQGILTAVDKGASIINISLGSYGDSQVLRDAVAYADAHGVVIVAAAGNNGIERLTYPAAYQSVVSVGSVDARGERLDFSNQSLNLDAVAPGYNLDVAWPGSKIAEFSGTSASSPIVAGTIAAAMSEYNLTATKATETVLAKLDDAGSAGTDASYGGGIVDVGRIMEKNTSGIYDAALASQALSFQAGSGQVEVVVQNRGTETLNDAVVTVTADNQQVQFHTGKIEADAVATQKVTVGSAANLQKPGATVQSTVTLPAGLTDTNTTNDTRKAQVK